MLPGGESLAGKRGGVEHVLGMELCFAKLLSCCEFLSWGLENKFLAANWHGMCYPDMNHWLYAV